MAEATQRKAPLERTADRLARLFLPVVLGVALATLVGWRIYSGQWSAGFIPALGVLVVACPCPLVLATPTAVMAAMAWLAKRQIGGQTGDVLGAAQQVAEMAVLAAAAQGVRLFRVHDVAETRQALDVWQAIEKK